MKISNVAVQNRKVRVLLVDDHQAIRDGLARVLQGHLDIEVVGQATDGAQAVDLALRLQPDVVLMDVNMPMLDGIEATRHICSQLPHVRIIGLSAFGEEAVAHAMVSAGAADYLPKTAMLASLISTIRRAHSE